VAERPRRRDPGEVGPLRGGRRSRGCPGAGQAGRCPVRLVRSAVGMSVQPVERTSSVHASGVQASGASRCPAGQASGVRGAAAALSAPRWTPEWLGVAGRPGRAQRVDVPPWPVGRRGRLPASGRTRRDGAAVAVAGSHEVDVAQGRRLAGVPAAAPPWPQRADAGAGPGPGCRPVAGSMGQSRCWTEQVLTGPPQGVLGRSPAWCRPWA
jgi:hypothetical protein